MDWMVPVFDGHAHFPAKYQAGAEGLYSDWGEYAAWYKQTHGEEKWNRVLSKSFEGQKDWWRGWTFPVPEPDGDDIEATAGRWSAELDKNNIQGILWVTGGGNEQLSEVLKLDPRFFGLAHHEPFLPDAGDRLRYAVRDLGLSGYKMYGPALRRRLDDPTLYNLWAAAEELNVPCLIHFGILGGAGGIGAGANIDPLALHDVAKGFPDVPFIVPHFGTGYVRELLQLAWSCPNVYVDTCGNNEWLRWMDYPMSLADVFRRFYETIGPDRIIFGTDSASFPRGLATRYVQEHIHAAWSVGIKGEDMAKIFSGNIRRLLKADERRRPATPEPANETSSGVNK